MGKKTTDILIEKAINALISSIEIYNKPDFKYRDENFSILLINAWELLLKAKIIEDNNNKRESLYIRKYHIKRNGEKGKQWKYERTRTGNYMTISIIKCIRRLSKEIDEAVISNIITLLEIRDNSTHFYTPSLDLVKNIHEIGSASIENFITLLNSWFKKDLSNYNLYLLPLAFFGQNPINAVANYKEEKYLIDYIEQEKKRHPYKNSSPTNYALYINIGLSKTSKGASGVYLTNDPRAPSVQLDSKQLKAKYPFDYDALVKKCNTRYSNFKLNQSFHTFRRNYFTNPKYCYPLFPNLNETGNPKYYYSSAILEKLDKIYTKI